MKTFMPHLSGGLIADERSAVRLLVNRLNLRYTNGTFLKLFINNNNIKQLGGAHKHYVSLVNLHLIM